MFYLQINDSYLLYIKKPLPKESFRSGCYKI